MARRTQAHQIIRGVGAAFGERDYMVDFLDWCVLACFQTLFTQWMLRHIPGADALPNPAVPFAGGGVALVLFVKLVSLLLMRRAISAVREFRAAGVGAGFLGFIRHGSFLL